MPKAADHLGFVFGHGGGRRSAPEGLK